VRNNCSIGPNRAQRSMVKYHTIPILGSYVSTGYVFRVSQERVQIELRCCCGLWNVRVELVRSEQ
jgi:hypothetical protein